MQHLQTAAPIVFYSSVISSQTIPYGQAKFSCCLGLLKFIPRSLPHCAKSYTLCFVPFRSSDHLIEDSTPPKENEVLVLPRRLQNKWWRETTNNCNFGVLRGGCSFGRRVPVWEIQRIDCTKSQHSNEKHVGNFFYSSKLPSHFCDSGQISQSTTCLD